MLRSARAGSLFLRSTAAAGARGRLGPNAGPAAVSSLGATHSTSNSLGQARFLSATPGSVDEKKDDAPPQGFMKRVMGKDSCVVRLYFLNCELIGTRPAFAFGRKACATRW